MYLENDDCNNYAGFLEKLPKYMLKKDLGDFKDPEQGFNIWPLNYYYVFK